MPQRTNDFQEIVSLIHRALAPRGAKIVESAMVEVAGLTTLREVDVLIESEFAPYKIKIAIEAKDESRKLSLQAFDSLVAKYRGECRVLVDRFVIVTTAGFSKGVLEKARRLGVDLLTLTEARDKDWGQLLPGKLEFRISPHVCDIVTDPPIAVSDKKKYWREGRVFCAQGHDHGTLIQVATHDVFRVFRRHPEQLKDIERQVAASPNGNGFASIPFNKKGGVVRFAGEEFPLERITVKVHFVYASGELKTRAFDLTSTEGNGEKVRHIEGIAGGKKFSFVFPGTNRPDKIAVRISSAPRGKPAG